MKFSADAPISRLFNEYASYHTTRGNQATHMIGIPLIVVAILGLGSYVRWDHFGGIDLPVGDLGFVIWALVSVWAVRLSPKLGFPYLFVTFALYLLGAKLSPAVNLALFVVGWAFQGIGHSMYEKKAPAFKDNALHLLVGPYWIFAKLVGAWPSTKN